MAVNAKLAGIIAAQHQELGNVKEQEGWYRRYVTFLKQEGSGGENETLSRALGNLGRSYVKTKKYREGTSQQYISLTYNSSDCCLGRAIAALIKII